MEDTCRRKYSTDRTLDHIVFERKFSQATTSLHISILKSLGILSCFLTTSWIAHLDNNPVQLANKAHPEEKVPAMSRCD